MARVEFYSGTRAQYDALKEHSRSALYFLEDTGELYKGDQPYSCPAQVVQSWPSAQDVKAGRIYVLESTGQTRVWSRGGWTEVSPLLEPVQTLTSSKTDVPSSAAVKAYIDDRLQWRSP